jgi:chromosome segregation ATPase
MIRMIQFGSHCCSFFASVWVAVCDRVTSCCASVFKHPNLSPQKTSRQELMMRQIAYQNDLLQSQLAAHAEGFDALVKQFQQVTAQRDEAHAACAAAMRDQQAARSECAAMRVELQSVGDEFGAVRAQQALMQKAVIAMRREFLLTQTRLQQMSEENAQLRAALALASTTSVAASGSSNSWFSSFWRR